MQKIRSGFYGQIIPELDQNSFGLSNGHLKIMFPMMRLRFQRDFTLLWQTLLSGVIRNYQIIQPKYQNPSEKRTDKHEQKGDSGSRILCTLSWSSLADRQRSGAGQQQLIHRCRNSEISAWVFWLFDRRFTHTHLGKLVHIFNSHLDWWPQQ